MRAAALTIQVGNAARPGCQFLSYPGWRKHLAHLLTERSPDGELVAPAAPGRSLCSSR
jgi:hypothetical protein